MGEVVELDVQTSLDIPSETLLRKAIENGVTNVVIIGYDPDGALYLASADADCGAILWSIEKAKRRLLQEGD